MQVRISENSGGYKIYKSDADNQILSQRGWEDMAVWKLVGEWKKFSTALNRAIDFVGPNFLVTKGEDVWYVVEDKDNKLAYQVGVLHHAVQGYRVTYTYDYIDPSYVHGTVYSKVYRTPYNRLSSLYEEEVVDFEEKWLAVVNFWPNAPHSFPQSMEMGLDEFRDRCPNFHQELFGHAVYTGAIEASPEEADSLYEKWNPTLEEVQSLLYSYMIEEEEWDPTTTIYPLYMFCHSGCQISIYPYRDPWDSGPIGFLACWGPNPEQEAKNYIRTENALLSGDVGFVDLVEIDSEGNEGVALDHSMLSFGDDLGVDAVSILKEVGIEVDPHSLDWESTPRGMRTSIIPLPEIKGGRNE